MAKRQTRRTVSLKGTTCQRLKNYCERNGLSVSGYLESLVGPALDREGDPVVVQADIPIPPKPAAPADHPSAHFTF